LLQPPQDPGQQANLPDEIAEAQAGERGHLPLLILACSASTSTGRPPVSAGVRHASQEAPAGSVTRCVGLIIGRPREFLGDGFGKTSFGMLNAPHSHVE
jgi:hypothetical protein